MSASGQYLYGTGQWLDAGVPKSSLLRSSDLGASWCVASTLRTPTDVVVPSPADDARLYGLQLSSDESTLELIRTSDAGVTWSHADLPVSQPFALFPSATDPDVVHLAAQNGAPWISRDGGDSWTELPLPDELKQAPIFVSTIVDRSAPDRVALLDYMSSRFFVTTDSGAGWQPSHPFDPATLPGITGLSAGPDGYLYAAGAATLAVSSDWGSSWTSHQLPQTLTLPLTSASGTTLFVTSGSELWRSRDHGESFEPLSQLDDQVTPLLSLDDQRVLGQSQHGSLVVTEDAGQTWQVHPAVPLPQGLLESPVEPWPIWSTFPPAFSDDGGLSWRATSSIPRFLDGGSATGAFRFGEGPVLEHTNDGVNWEGVTVPSNVQQIHAVASCTAPLRCLYLLYGSTGRPVMGSALASHIARSVDGGRTWEEPFAVPEGAFYMPDVMAVWPDDAEHLVVGGGAGLMETRDAGRSFKQADVPGLTRAGSVALFAGGVGLVTSNNLIASENAVFRSTDGGATWNQLDVDAGELQLSHAHEGSVLVISGGILRSDDRGASWNRLWPIPGSDGSQAAAVFFTSVADAPGGAFIATESTFGLVRFE